MSASNQSGSALTIPTGAESQKHARNVMAQTKDRCTDAFEDVDTGDPTRNGRCPGNSQGSGHNSQLFA